MFNLAVRRWFGAAVCCMAMAAGTCLYAAGTGLSGEYFTANNFTGTKSTRTDATVDFAWSSGSPGFGGLGTNNFSVRWSGQIEPRYSETYTFHVTADDGATLWINERLVLSRTFYAATSLVMTAQVPMTAGQRVAIRLEYFEKTGGAQVQLEWASASQAREVVPQSQLYPVEPVYERGSILREHWAGVTGTAVSALTGLTNYPNNPSGREFFLSFECLQTNWTTNVGTRVSGYVVPPADGSYTFAVAAADTAELWLSTGTNPANKSLIASVTNAVPFRAWSNQPNQISASQALLAGQKYYVELLQKSGTGNHHWSVAWQTPTNANFTVIAADALVPAGLDRTVPSQSNFLNTVSLAHPRLFATQERFEWLKRQLTNNPTGQPATWYNSLYRSATNLFTNGVVVYVLDERSTILTDARTVLARFYQLGISWRVTGDTNFPARAWMEITNAGALANWNDNNHFLDTAEMSHAFAVAYDWMHDYWSTNQRTYIRTNLETKGLLAGLKAYSNNVGWSQSSGNNWNFVCNGGLTMAALALGTDSESLAEQVLNKATASLAPVLRHWSADNGVWYEGPGYWDYSTDYLHRHLAAMESTLGTDFGLGKTNGMSEAGLFSILLGSATNRVFNFADVGGTGPPNGPQMFYYARRYLRPEYAAYQRLRGAADALGALWHDTRGTNAAATGYNADHVFLGATAATPFNSQHVGVMRSGWDDLRETWIAFKGGEMGADHGNLDAGNFVLEALGKRWSWELGSDDYALPGYFSDNPSAGTDRWDYYRNRAEGQNTLVVNPGAGPDTRLNLVAPINFFQSRPTGDGSLAIMDLTPVETNVTRVWRGFRLFNARKDVLVQDEIVASTPATTWWFMHIATNSTQVAIDPDGSAVMLTQGVERLWMKILSGGGNFAVSNAVPLPTSPNPAGQSTNLNYGKLVLKLTGVTNTTLAVLMKPLSPGQNPPLVLPTVTPLAQWYLPSDDPPLALDGSFTTPQNTVLDVNLTTLATDTVTPGSNLVFAVSGATNGTVTLQPDGRTARFTPSANFFGSAQFIYTVTDTAGNTSSAGVAITVLPATWYWDTSTAAGLQAASGTWSGTDANWSSSTAGSNPLLVWPAQGNDANFIGSGGSYAITISGTQKVNQIFTTNGTWTFSGGALNHASGPLTITAEADTTLNSPLAAATDFTKLGAGRLTLGAPVTFSGDITVPTGTLRVTTNNALPVTADTRIGSTNDTVGNLDVNANQTLASLNFQSLTIATNTVSITAGNTLVVSNTGPGIAFGVGNYGSTIGGITATTRVSFAQGGSLAVLATNGVFSIEPSGTNNASTALAVLDLSKLSNFTASVSNFNAAVIGGRPNNVAGQFTLNLASNNTITATNVVLGASGHGNGTVTITLGASNTINADTLVVVGGRYSGMMSFQTGITSNLTVRGVAGGSSRANFYLGDQINLSGLASGAGGSSTSSGTLNLAGGTVDALFNQMFLGVGASSVSSYGVGNGTIVFGGSNSLVDVNTVYLGYAASNSAASSTPNVPIHTGTLTMNGGALNVNSNLFLGYSADNDIGNTQKVTGVFNLNGGIVNIASNLFLGFATNSIGTATGNLNLTNGTLNVGGGILSSGVTATGTVTLAGATLNLNGRNLGSLSKPIALLVSSGTLQNLGEINGGTTALVKTTSGTFTLAGTNTYTGGTVLSAGTLRLAGNVAGGVTATNGNFSGNGNVGGSLTLGSAGSFRPQINGTAAGSGYDQLTVAGTVTLAGTLVPVVTNASALPNNSTLTIIRNDGASAVDGTFAGLPQLATFTNSSLVWRVNYQGGDGNDVVLTLLSGGSSGAPPVLAPVANYSLVAGQWLRVTNTATDADLPAQTLMFSLPVAPAEAVLNSVSGLLTWRPTLAQAPSTNTFTVTVTDNGTPSLSATQSLTVTVRLPVTPQMTAPLLTNGLFRLLLSGDLGPDYTVETSEDLVIWQALFSTNPAVVPFFWTDRGASNSPMRFYRVILGP